MECAITPERKRYLDELFDAMQIAAEGYYVYVCDLAYDYSRWSLEAIAHFDLPGEYMVGCKGLWGNLIFPGDQDVYLKSIDDIFAGVAKHHDMQYRVRNRDGQYVVCTCRGTVIHDESGNPVYFVGTIQNNGINISMDSLTGLQNLYGLFSHLDGLYQKRTKANIMMIGIRHFSTVNEMWGYDFGNMVIHKVVQELKQIFANDGILFRGDGVRFILLSRSLSMEQLCLKYEEVCRRISAELEMDGYHPDLDISGSALEISTFDVKPQAMYSCLNYAYTISCEQGNGQLQIFRNEVDQNRTDLMTLINVIRRSIEHDCEGFVLYYQPIMNAETGTVSGCEALLRWYNPEYGLVPPNRFIPVIENDPSFFRLGEWILRKAMEDAKPFLKNYPDFELNVNISYNQLKRASFVETVRRNLEITGYPAKNLCLEITERCRLLDIRRLSLIGTQLQEMGVHFAIDDFGTGYSSVGILKQLKCDVVKIDKMFVDHIACRDEDARLLKALNEVAMIHGSTVCAEGVETQEQCEIIRKCGIHTVQGYYFSKPVPLETFQEKYVTEK